MNITLDNQIVESMRQKPTEDLLAIWQSNDRTQWSDSAFEAMSQVLTERGGVAPAQALRVTAPEPNYKGVRGWLRFLCISLTILAPLRALAAHGAKGEDIFHPTLDMLDLLVPALGIYVGICLWRIRPNAVIKARVFLWLVAGLNALNIASAFFDIGALQNSLPASIPTSVSSLLASLLWLIYLGSSKRVTATYGV